MGQRQGGFDHPVSGPFFYDASSAIIGGLKKFRLVFFSTLEMNLLR